MLFYDPLFFAIFFPTLYAAYLALHGRDAKKWWLLAGSIVFYIWGEPIFVAVLVVSALLDYRLARFLPPADLSPWRHAIVTIGIAGNLAILVFYKYADFIAANVNLTLGPLIGGGLPLLRIALPIGVSFVVFEKITYLVDTYRGTSAPARSFLDYCLFVFFFPKLLAGPILKYHEMQEQIGAPSDVRWTDFSAGFLRFARGMARKLLIADPVGAFADQAFGAKPGDLGSTAAWLGLVCFTLQIYFDFAGYSDMAIGLARMLGFRLRENFNMPYISRSLTEFWRRWHISLSTWIRDYLYIPLGGNRDGALRTHVNLWICFLACGLWHGAAWNFVLWGAYNGLVLTLDRLFLLQALQRSGAVVSTTATLMIVMIGWAIFRATSLEHLSGYLAAMFDWSRAGIPMTIPADVIGTVAIGGALSLLPATPLFDRLCLAYDQRAGLQRLAALALILLYVAAASRAFAISFKPFIYFRF